MLVFVATDGSEWIPTKVLGGELTTIDVAAFVREAFPRQFIMMYDAATCTRLSEAVPTKLLQSGETRIITPLVDAADYAATEWFTCRPVEEIRSRLPETLSCVFRCLRDNLTKQTTRINAEVSQTKSAINAHKEETLRLLNELPSFLETLERTICPTSAGRTALAVLGVNPNLAQLVEERMLAKDKEFQQLEGDIQLDIQKQQDFMEDQANRIEETVGKVGSSGATPGSGGASGLSLSTASSQAQHLAKVTRIVQGFRKQTHVVIGQWRAFIRHLGLLRTAAEPLELRRLERCATQLPSALDELRPLLAARCAFAHAASSLVAPLEARYLKLCEQSRNWRFRYGDILEELAHAAPHSTEPLPPALLPRDRVVPFSIAHALEPEVTEVQRDQILERAVSDLMLLKDGSGSPSSSLGAPSRQCTATPPQQPAASDVARVEELEAQLRDMEALLAKAREETSVAREAMESGRRAVDALEATLTSRETELVQARDHAARLAMELANSRNTAAEAVDYMQKQLQLGAANPHAFFSFSSRGSDRGEWTIPDDAPSSIAGKTFTVRVDALQRDVSMGVLVSIELRAGMEHNSAAAEGRRSSIETEVCDGDTRQCVCRYLIGRHLDFERNGKGCQAVVVLPRDKEVRPDLRGTKVVIDLHPESKAFHATSAPGAGGGAGARPDRLTLSVVEVTSEVELSAIALCAK